MRTVMRLLCRRMPVCFSNWTIWTELFRKSANPSQNTGDSFHSPIQRATPNSHLETLRRTVLFPGIDRSVMVQPAAAVTGNEPGGGAVRSLRLRAPRLSRTKGVDGNFGRTVEADGNGGGARPDGGVSDHALMFPESAVTIPRASGRREERPFIRKTNLSAMRMSAQI